MANDKKGQKVQPDTAVGGEEKSKASSLLKAEGKARKQDDQRHDKDGREKKDSERMELRGRA